MANFNEHALEMSIMELFKDEGYTYVSGDQIHRERTEVLLTDDLKQWIIAQEENNPHIIELTDRKKIDHMIILYWD